MQQAEYKTISVWGLNVRYIDTGEAGDGPVVLLLHGLADSLLSWYCNVDALAGAGYRVIAPDLPGSGESDKPGHLEYDPDSAAEIGSIPMGTVGFSQNFSALAVLIGQLDAFAHDRDRHLIYIDSSLAAMAFQFALEVQGVSSCCINWPDIKEREKRMEARLGLARHERPIMSISIGYADPEGRVPYSQKKSLDEIRTYAR